MSICTAFRTIPGNTITKTLYVRILVGLFCFCFCFLLLFLVNERGQIFQVLMTILKTPEFVQLEQAEESLLHLKINWHDLVMG